MTPAGSQCMVVSPTNHQPGNPMTIDQAVEKVWPLLTDPTNPMPAWAGLDEIMNLTGCEIAEAFLAVCGEAADRWATDRRSLNGGNNGSLYRNIRDGRLEAAARYRELGLTLFHDGVNGVFKDIRDLYVAWERPIEILAEMQKYVPAQETA